MQHRLPRGVGLKCLQFAPALPASVPRITRSVRAAAASGDDDVKQRAKQFSEEFLKKASASAKSASEQLQDKAQRTWRRLDSEHDLTGKAERASKRVEEAAREVDALNASCKSCSCLLSPMHLLSAPAWVRCFLLCLTPYAPCAMVHAGRPGGVAARPCWQQSGGHG